MASSDASLPHDADATPGRPVSAGTGRSRILAWVDQSRAGWVDPLVIGVLAVVVTGIGYWRPSIWTDEAATITSATRSVSQLWAMLHNIDAVHGPYYLFMHYWIDVFGISAWSIRLPSLLAVGVAAAGTVVLARQLANPRVALVAGLVYAVLPRVTWSSTDARSAALTIAAAAWLSVVLVAAVRRGRWWWVLYGALTALSLALFFFLVLVVLGHGVTLAWSMRRRIRSAWPWLAAVVGATVVVAPFLLIVVSEAGQISPAPPTFRRTLSDVLVRQFFLGALPTKSQEFPLRSPPLWAVSALALAALCWALIGWAVLTRRDRQVQRPDAPVGLLALLLPWIVVPTGLLVAYSVARTPIYNPRYLAFAMPAVAVLVAIAIVALGRQWLRVGVLALVAALSVPVFVSNRGLYAKKGTDWITVARVIDERAAPGDVVVYGIRNHNLKLTTRRIEVAYPDRLTELRDITLHKTGAQTATLWGTSHHLSGVMTELAGASRVWLITENRQNARADTKNEQGLLVGAGYHKAWSWTGPSTIVREYVR